MLYYSDTNYFSQSPSLSKLYMKILVIVVFFFPVVFIWLSIVPKLSQFYSFLLHKLFVYRQLTDFFLLLKSFKIQLFISAIPTINDKYSLNFVAEPLNLKY